MAVTNLGRVVPLYKGTYSAAAQYTLNDIVAYSGKVYWHTGSTPTTGTAPTDTTVWTLMVEPGALPSTTNLIAGDGSGGSADSGLDPSLIAYAGAAQTLTDGQKAQARTNIGAVSMAEISDALATAKYGVSGVGGSSPALTRLWNSVGKTAVPGTDGTAASSDFDGIIPFERKKCVGYWIVENNAAKFVVNAYEGDADYAEDGTMGDYVAVEVLPFWYTDGGGILGVSPNPIPGWSVHPVCLNTDGTIRPKTYLPVYELALKNGHAVSLPGYHPVFGEYKTMWDYARTYGDGSALDDYAILEPSVVDHYERLLMTIEYATQNMQNIMQGAVSVRYTTDVVQKSGTGVNSIVMDSAGENYAVGQSIYIGSSYSDKNVTVDAYNVITAAEKCNSDGTPNSSGTYWLITFSGTARDVTAGTTQVGSRPWITGSCSAVRGHTGSPVSNSNGKYPCKYRHRENPYGNINKTCLDLMSIRVSDGGGYKAQWYYHPALTPSVYYPSENSKPDLTDLQTAANGWKLLSVETPAESYQNGYIKELAADPRYPCVAVPTLTVGGSATTYYCDYVYLVDNSAIRTVRRRGYFQNGVFWGPCGMHAHFGPSNKQLFNGGGLYFAQ